MSAHPQQTGEDSSQENQQEPQTYDDRLAADLYKDYSSQNQLAIQIFLAFAGKGVNYAVDVRDAYAFFVSEKIDTEKLIKDPKYREKIKRYAGHLNRWEKKDAEGGINKSNKLGAVLEGANKAIKEVDATNEKLVVLKDNLIKDYSTELQNLYGLSKDEINAITQRAKYAIQKDPSLSLQDLMQQEGQVIARERIKKEVIKEEKKEPVEENLTPKQIEDRRVGKVNTRLSDIDERFSQRTIIAGSFESNSNFELTYDCKQKIDQVIAQPPVAPQPPPSPQPVSPPPVVIPPSVPPMQSIPAASGLPFGFSLPNISLPHISLPGLPSLGGLSGGMGLNIGGTIGSGLKNLFGSGGMLSKGLSGLANLAKGLLPKLASFALPPLGAALTALTAIDALTGGILSKSAGFVIGGVIIVAVGLPFAMVLFSSGTFSSFTGSNPLAFNTSSKNIKNISWGEFEKNFLTMKKNDQKGLSWKEFEKSIFVKELSLNPDRHDDVQE